MITIYGNLYITYNYKRFPVVSNARADSKSPPWGLRCWLVQHRHPNRNKLTNPFHKIHFIKFISFNFIKNLFYKIIW